MVSQKITNQGKRRENREKNIEKVKYSPVPGSRNLRLVNE